MGTRLQRALAPVTRRCIGRWQNLNVTCTSMCILKITFCFRGRSKWSARVMPPLISVDELKASRAEGVEFIAARELRLSRLLIAYIASGLFFMLLPGTFLGVWNLLAISSQRSVETVSPAWIQANGHAQVFGW